MNWLAQLVAALTAALTAATAPAVRTTPTTTAPAASQCPQWYGLALEVGWSADDWPVLDRLLWCESRCEPDAYNASGASGLLQLMPMWHDGRDPFDPRTNLTIALDVKALQGWKAWSCYGH